MYQRANEHENPMKAPPCQFSEIIGKIQVLSLDVRSSLSEEELSDRLRKWFGKGGLGLEVKAVGPGGLTFEGGGGYVSAVFHGECSGTRLNIVTHGWAVQVKKFFAELP